MAYAYISEYSEMIEDRSGNTVPVPREPAITTQRISFTTSTASAELNEATKFVRVETELKAHYLVAKDPTALVTSPYLVAHIPEFFGIAGEGLKIAFYDGSS